MISKMTKESIRKILQRNMEFLDTQIDYEKKIADKIWNEENINTNKVFLAVEDQRIKIGIKA